MSMPYDIVTAYNALLEEVEPLLFIVRDSGLQREGIEQIDAFVTRADQARLGAIAAQDAERANLLLGFRSAARSLSAELNMYLLLKQDRPEEARAALIGAQSELGAAARAHPSFRFEPKARHLRAMESHFFPPQVFMSAGMIVREQECSICRDDYEKCDHIVGRPYVGRFCTIVLKKVSLDHIALVEDPADRLCRVISFKVPGGTRNRMTWVVTADDETTGEKGPMQAIVATAGDSSSDVETEPASAGGGSTLAAGI
jgi:hypothetical protein